MKKSVYNTVYGFIIETWDVNVYYLTEDWVPVGVSAVSHERYAYETSAYREFLDGKKVTYMGKFIDSSDGGCIQKGSLNEIMNFYIYRRDLRNME